MNCVKCGAGIASPVCFYCGMDHKIGEIYFLMNPVSESGMLEWEQPPATNESVIGEGSSTVGREMLPQGDVVSALQKRYVDLSARITKIQTGAPHTQEDMDSVTQDLDKLVDDLEQNLEQSEDLYFVEELEWLVNDLEELANRWAAIVAEHQKILLQAGLRLAAVLLIACVLIGGMLFVWLRALVQA